MIFIRMKDGKYPCDINDVGADNPNVYLPACLSDAEYRAYGYAVVQATPAPEHDPDRERPVQGAPKEKFGIYLQQWKIEALGTDIRDEIVNAKALHRKALWLPAIQTHIDAVAQQRNYDNGVSCISYAEGSHPRYSAEGKAFRDWRDEVWNAFEKRDKKLSITAFLKTLPVILWPEPTI